MAGQHEARDLERAHRCAEIRTQFAATEFDATIAKRSDADAIEDVVASQGSYERQYRFVALGVDVDPRRRPGEQHLVEPGDPGSSIDAQLIDFHRGEVSDVGVESGAGLQVDVVVGVEDTVSAEMHVGFEIAVAQVDCVLKGRHRVLGPFARAASVGECSDTIVFEVRMTGGHLRSVVSKTVVAVAYAFPMDGIRQDFAACVAPGEGRLASELDEAALLLAKVVDPTVDVGAEVDRLDQLADACSADTAASLAVELFGGVDQTSGVHFVGNARAYYDADNSLLPRVISNRRGIPITLSLLFVEVARRRSISAHGIGMPGHFLVGSADGYIDPFHGGVCLDRAGCELLFSRITGVVSGLPDAALRPTPRADIIKRMLANLAAIASHQTERRLLWAVRSMLASFPDATFRERVQLAYAAADVGQYTEAVAAASQALSEIPEAARPRLQEQILRWGAALN